jgi:hypothetical protein
VATFRRLIVTGAIFLVAIWAWLWLSGNDPRVAFTDFEDFDDEPSIAFVQVAAAYGPWKRDALYLLCRGSGRYQFVLKSRLVPFDRGYLDELLPIGAPDEGRIALGRRRAVPDQVYETRFQVIRTGLIDTIVSPEFDRREAARFTAMLRGTSPEQIAVDMRVQAILMSRTSDAGQIVQFEDSCREQG